MDSDFIISLLADWPFVYSAYLKQGHSKAGYTQAVTLYTCLFFNLQRINKSRDVFPSLLQIYDSYLLCSLGQRIEPKRMYMYGMKGPLCHNVRESQFLKRYSCCTVALRVKGSVSLDKIFASSFIRVPRLEQCKCFQNHS